MSQLPHVKGKHLFGTRLWGGGGGGGGLGIYECVKGPVEACSATKGCKIGETLPLKKHLFQLSTPAGSRIGQS